jgi:hypothetical protein
VRSPAGLPVKKSKRFSEKSERARRLAIGEEDADAGERAGLVQFLERFSGIDEAF